MEEETSRAHHFATGKRIVCAMKYPFAFSILSLALTFGARMQASSNHAFQHLVVFGDSLSDTGNRLVIDGVPHPPYHHGRWTNGPNWVDYFAPLAGFGAPKAYLQGGGTNFAVGGATSEYMMGEVATYIRISGGHVPPNNLYVFWIGANDFRAGLAPSQTLDFIRVALTDLAMAGARWMVVITVPDISITPEIRAAGSAAAAKQSVTAVNAGLESRLPPLARLLGIHVTLIDINPILHRVIAHPEAYGFTNSKGAAFDLQTGAEAANPDAFVFWDGFHPTTHAHKIAAETIFGELQGRRVLAPVSATGGR